MKPARCVTALLMGDPDPDRLERSEALRRTLPEPREVDLSEWVARADEPIGPASALTPALENGQH